MPTVPESRLQTYLASAVQVAAGSPVRPNPTLRDRLIADAVRDLPGLRPAQLARLAASINRACGVKT